jgi:F0F1-type ATP synthase membrane subunit c/vacuolar-type H+-ATPase subunit K
MADLRRTYRTAAIIGVAMMASVIIYAVVIDVLSRAEMRPAPPLGQEQARTLLFVLLGICAVLFLVIRSLAKAGPPLSGTVDPEQAAQRLLVRSITQFALCEVPAILGLVAFILGGNSTDGYLFILISLFLFSLHFPKYRQWEEQVRQPRR